MWKPLQEQQREGDIDCHNNIECNGTHSIEGQSLSRQLWLWIHASAYEEGYDALKLACHKQVIYLIDSCNNSLHYQTTQTSHFLLRCAETTY